MSSRKRKNSAIPGKDRNPSKRARLFSGLWQSQEAASASPAESSCRSSGSVYSIKAIIGERPREYLIDWADDPITGEKFKPDWQPRGNVNTAAIEAWESKKLSKRNRNNRSKRKTRRSRRLRFENSAASHESTAGTRKLQSDLQGQTASRQTTKTDSPDQTGSSSRAEIQSSSFDLSKYPNAAVQISHQSNFDRDLYITYISSLSTQGNSSTLAEQPDSGIGESSPEPEVISQHIGKDRVVPDSQSLPGSSSYIPSTNATSDSIVAQQTPLESASQRSVLSSDNTLHKDKSTNPGLPNESLSAFEDPIEDSLILEVAESQPSPLSLRSRSEPPPSSTESCSSPSRSRGPSLLRSKSDFAASYHDQVQCHEGRVARQSRRAYNRRQRLDKSSSVSRTRSRQDPASKENQHISSGTQVSQLTIPESQPSTKLGEVPSRHISSFQTQVPFLPTNQAARLSPESPESLQARESTATLDIPATQISSGVPGQVYQARASIEIIPAIVSPARRRTTTAGTFEILEDPDQKNHLSQATTTDDSVLSIRDPNSQPTRQTFVEGIKEDITDLKKAQEHSFGLFSSSDLVTDTLPNTSNSKAPPEPPSSEDDMSDTSPDKAGASGSSQALGIREKLRKIREDGAAKREAHREAALRRAKSQTSQPSQPTSASTSPSTTINEQQISHPSGVQAPPYQNLQRHPSQPINTRGTPILPRSDRRLSQMSIAGAYPLNQEELRMQIQTSRQTQSPRAMRPAPTIPDKLPPQIQREPSRLEVQPVIASKDLSMPVRHSQSVPHTPTTPSKLSMHKEASPAQTVTLQPMWLSQMEFIIPLAMQPRILSQYMDTLEYYKRAVKKNMTNETLSRSDLDKLNELLGRLANVATHIGLEGGGPGSQEEVLPEQEAAYAESSSEKFSFLGHLLTLMKDNATHIAIICKPSLLDIVELFLRGKKVRYTRPDTRTRSDIDVVHSRLEVSLIASGELGASVMPRSAELVVALDETFKSSDPQVMALRKHIINIGQLAPVVRLVVYSSVEHLDLCLHPTLDPIDRIRKLIFYVWHTQEIIGRLQSHEPSARSFAEKVAAILHSGEIRAFWNLPRIGPIENLPAMDSDSTLSDPLSERAIEQMRPEGPPKYWPNPVPSRIGEPGNQIIQGGKRPFDLEYGDTFEVQTKKQKMAARVHRGLPPEVGNQHFDLLASADDSKELSTIESLQRQLVEAKDREKEWQAKESFLKSEIADLQKWAGIRQNDFEALRDRHSNEHHDRLELSADLNRKTHDLEKARAEIDNLKEERTMLKDIVTDLRTQLANHSNPDLARLEQSAAKIRALESEIASLNRKNANLQSESATIRGVYTSSSSTISDLNATVSSLEAELKPLRRRVEELETRRKAENRTKNEAEMKLRKEIENLKKEVKSRENLVRRKEDEIREVRRGRGGVVTRGSSAQPVARSPRGNGGGAVGSRGASPAAGMVGEGGSGVREGREGRERGIGLRGRFNLEG